MPIRAVVFDLDGLMFNTESVFVEVAREVLRRRERTPAPDLMVRMMGRRAKESLQVMIDLHELTDQIDPLAEECQTVFFELAEDRLRPMAGLLELLERIEAKGLPKAVATSSGRPYTEKILGQFGLLDRFSFLLTSEDVTHGKPHPEIYLTATSRLGIPAGEVLVLEDSEAGTNAAAGAGTVIVSIPHEHSARHDFSKATLVAASLADPRVLALLND